MSFDDVDEKLKTRSVIDKCFLLSIRLTLFTHYLSPAILLHPFFDTWDASQWLLWSKRHHWLPNHAQTGIGVRGGDSREQIPFYFRIVSSRGSPFCSRDPLLASPLALDHHPPRVTLHHACFSRIDTPCSFCPCICTIFSLGPCFSFMAGFIPASALQFALLASIPFFFHLDGGDTCYRYRFVFVSILARHEVHARIEWYGF